MEERNGAEKLGSWFFLFFFFALNPGPCGRPYGRLAAPQHRRWTLPQLTHPLVGHLQGRRRSQSNS